MIKEKMFRALGNLQSFAIDGTKGSKIVDINVNIVKDYITILEEENNRLNNIINELKKVLDLNLPFRVIGVRHLKNKLQELKENKQ